MYFNLAFLFVLKNKTLIHFYFENKINAYSSLLSNTNMSFPIQGPICLPATRSRLMAVRWAEVRKARNPVQALQSAASHPLRPRPWTSCTNTPTSTRANHPRSARRRHTSEERQRGKERGSARENEIEKWIGRVRLPHSESCSLTTTWATHSYLASTTCLMLQVSTPLARFSAASQTQIYAPRAMIYNIPNRTIMFCTE